jgi:hypothetical protein
MRQMKNPDPEASNGVSLGESGDLARRLARYRTRVEAEGRRRSLRIIDQAIREASRDGSRDA